MPTISFDTFHDDLLHDIQPDYYGRRLATASSDRTIRIFALPTDSTQQPHLVDTLKGHDGPVWSLAWAHPRFGSILASAGYDGRVIIWKEQESSASTTAAAAGGNGSWMKIKEYTGHTASVNSVQWAPHELGAMLACASSDGRCTVLHFRDDGTWQEYVWMAHHGGANAVSWDAAVPAGALLAAQAPASGGQQTTTSSSSAPLQRRLATGGCDHLVKIWQFSTTSQAWIEESVLRGHDDWVRDVAFAPSIGLPRTRLASCGQDKRVKIWVQSKPGEEWVERELQEDGFPDVVWRLSWSLSGAVLAVSGGDNKVGLWRETVKGAWECVEEMDERSTYASTSTTG